MLCRGPFVGLGYVAPTGFLTNPSNIGGLGFRIDCGGSFDLLVCVASTRALLGKSLILIHEHCYER